MPPFQAISGKENSPITFQAQTQPRPRTTDSHGQQHAMSYRENNIPQGTPTLNHHQADSATRENIMCRTSNGVPLSGGGDPPNPCIRSTDEYLNGDTTREAKVCGDCVTAL